MPTSTLLIRPAKADELTTIWHAAYSNLEWKKFDAPYFPFAVPSLEEFARGGFARLQAGIDAQVIEVDGVIVGQVSAYWEYEATRWLEVGILLYSAGKWGAGTGRCALQMWLQHLFETREVARIGLSTWSGNPRMMRCAEAVGFTLEGRLRRCRYYDGVYYDAIKMGVLREEFFAATS